ncbi:PREDICTED: rho GTPase-activating protein 20-like [Thamnophis sirtalis]|uniref:Rho GTPase-activating protein 20-like n=1 Tax=Thamnophis sirtalis TaxID=35019 RepID=A0A6I9XJE1_9SAUR|nr:PREDICTED: rho GTPase-activating protein 20-like [Thamnophis sirtalis]
MEAMSPQQDHVGQGQSSSLTAGNRRSAAPEAKKQKMKSLAQRRQSAPSLVLSKALTKARTSAREGCFSPISPETCPLVQSFLSPARAFLLEGHVQLKTGLQTQERHLFLFTDILVIAKSKSQLHFKLKNQARLSEMWTASCLEEVCESSTNADRSFVLGWPTTNCVASFSSVEQKEKWFTSLQSRIKEEKAKDYPKSIPLKILAKDIGNCVYSKTLTITNLDTANDVILLALQQLGINGSEKDYQLWVNSGKEDAPYPLIGKCTKSVYVSVLVQFLIENCCRIFGEELTSVFADIMPKNDNREDGSDLSSFHLNDSSYDSLENELNDCADPAFDNLFKKRGKENRSRDSVLTLSDCDLDSPEAGDAQIKLSIKSQPVSISVGFHHKSSSREHSENESLCSVTSGYSSTAISDVLKSSRRHRRCSEPTIGLLDSKFTPLGGFHESAVRKASCDAVLSHTNEDYLEQFRSLQVEGQKLINQNLVMGIEVSSKDGPESRISEKKDVSNRLLLPPPLRLNICSRTSCSSLSSPGTSPSGSSMSSLDSAFSQFSDYSVFTPTEASSPLDCASQPQRKFGEASPDFNPFSGGHLGSGVSAFSNQANNNQTSSLIPIKKDNLEWLPHKNPVTLHPSTWLKSGASTMKNWTLRKRERASKQDEKKNTSVKITLESTTFPSESNLAQGQQGTGNVCATDVNSVAGHLGNGSPQDIGQFTSLPFCVMEAQEKRLKALELLAEQSKEEEEEENSTVFLPHKPPPPSLKPQSQNKPKPEADLGADHQGVTERKLNETARFPGVAVQQAADSKTDKSSLSRQPKDADINLENECYASSHPSVKAEDECSFQMAPNHSFSKTPEGTDANKMEWLKKLCSDPKFKDTDQNFFTEESYV